LSEIEHAYPLILQALMWARYLEPIADAWLPTDEE
jgi:hypothetical protein